MFCFDKYSCIFYNLLFLNEVNTFNQSLWIVLFPEIVLEHVEPVLETYC